MRAMSSCVLTTFIKEFMTMMMIMMWRNVEGVATHLPRWLYSVECQQYSIRLDALGYLCASCLLPAFEAA